MKRILVPCDFSETAERAYTFALNIATRTNAEVFVIKAIDFPFMYENSLSGVPYAFDSAQLARELERDARERFVKMKLSHSFQHDVSFEAIQGPVTPTIREFIHAHNIDLVVMGTHGASGLSEFLVGSNTEKIVRFSPIPVLTVRSAVNFSSIQNIVFPTMLEMGQTELISKLKELQSFFKATLHVLVVNTPYFPKRAEGLMTQLEEYAWNAGLEDFKLNIRENSSEQAGILDFVKEINGDMIAMGTNSRRGLAHLLYGSVAEDVVNHVEVPIWTYSIKQQNEKDK